MIVSNVALTNLTFRPICAPSALTRSTSMPITVCPSGPMNSFGAYVASAATVSVPFDLIAAGTSAAIDAFAPLVDAVVVELLLLLLVLLLLPHPASATMTSTGAAIARTDFLI